LTNAGVVGAARAVFVIGSANAGIRLAWLFPVAASAFTDRTIAGQCPKLANLNSST
jgi:hypothetical protein